jgi:peptidoglycan/xylan/chitin deacetylase (PgdA/CDA1 family)
VNRGTFTISLDFELHWGGFEKWPLDPLPASGGPLPPGGYRSYFQNTRQVIPEMLRLFANYEVHATWATVGLLMHRSRVEAEAHFPILKPTYTVRELSAYHYIESVGLGLNETDDPYHFADSLVREIVATPHQELGTHTFAHYYCNEAGQTIDQFRADLQAAQRAAAPYGVKLQSLVFPRNQFNDAYLRVCFEEGITAVRSNPLDWFWQIDSTQHESMWKRLNRGLDAYFSIGKDNTYPLANVPLRPGLPLCLPASRLLRPYRPQEWVLNHLKIQRIQHEMERAARNGLCYHLWWHPHNFGRYPVESLAHLEIILKHYLYCRRKYGMRSLSMAEVGEERRGLIVEILD